MTLDDQSALILHSITLDTGSAAFLVYDTLPTVGIITWHAGNAWSGPLTTLEYSDTQQVSSTAFFRSSGVPLSVNTASDGQVYVNNTLDNVTVNANGGTYSSTAEALDSPLSSTVWALARACYSDTRATLITPELPGTFMSTGTRGSTRSSIRAESLSSGTGIDRPPGAFYELAGLTQYGIYYAAGVSLDLWSGFVPHSWGLSAPTLQVDDTGGSTVFNDQAFWVTVDGTTQPLSVAAQFMSIDASSAIAGTLSAADGTLYVNGSDQTEKAGAVTISGTSVTGLTPAPINYSSIVYLTVAGSQGNNTITVTGTIRRADPTGNVWWTGDGRTDQHRGGGGPALDSERRHRRRLSDDHGGGERAALGHLCPRRDWR